LSPESISWIAVMVSNHNDPVALKPLLEKNVVWKLLKVAPPSSARIVVMSLWIVLDIFNSGVNLAPKLITKIKRNVCILCGDLSGIIRCPRVDDQRLHPASYLPQSRRNSSLETPTTSPESNSAERFATSSSSTQ
jgi:hypothetical protein